HLGSAQSLLAAVDRRVDGAPRREARQDADEHAVPQLDVVDVAGRRTPAVPTEGPRPSRPLVGQRPAAPGILPFAHCCYPASDMAKRSRIKDFLWRHSAGLAFLVMVLFVAFIGWEI